MTCMVSSKPKKGTGPFFKFLWCSNYFMTQKGYFSGLTQVYVNNVSGVYLLSPGFLASYWSAGV